MKPHPKTATAFIWAFSLCIVLGGQNEGPYHLSFKRDAVYLGGGILSLALGEYLHARVPERTITDLQGVDINRFDRVAIRYNSLEAKQGSNITLYSSAALSGFFPL